MTSLDMLRDAFSGRFQGETWQSWRAFLAAAHGVPPDNDEAAALVRRCTGRATLPDRPAREAWLIVGRRGGKSFISAVLAIYLACFRRYSLAPGERGTLMILAADRRQARVVKRYISGLLDSVPMLAGMVTNETQEAIDLRNGITIEIHSASYRAVRGYTVVGAICDEIAFWPTDDSANPDTEVLNALRPAMATVSGALLVCISSPYARRGELYRAWKQHFGKDGDPVLVWQADTRTMNPTVSPEVVAAAYADDDAVASAEYGAQFRRDVESLFAREAIDACVSAGTLERPPVAAVPYRAFVDPSGGSSDAMTLAIAHTEGESALLDAVREVRPAFSPEAVVGEFAALLQTYRLATVTGDRYGGEWPRERFRVHGVEYQIADRTKSDLYLALLPAINSGRAVLLDHARLIAQLSSLERRSGRGRDSVDHPPSHHDDIANAVAGALLNTEGVVPRIRRFGTDLVPFGVPVSMA